ncbi:MAG: hypothetical protein H6Q33_4210 [Deltaproteobacteria bacterium]|nr:hypothetical protein [Deltaproteobacteria bacterium]
MKKRSDDLRAEYDFASMHGGVRGKYAKAYRSGSNIVVLADDVASAFPTDDSVNRALRAMLDLAEAVPRTKKPSNKALQRPAAKRGHRPSSRQRRGGGR